MQMGAACGKTRGELIMNSLQQEKLPLEIFFNHSCSGPSVVCSIFL